MFGFITFSSLCISSTTHICFSTLADELTTGSTCIKKILSLVTRHFYIISMVIYVTTFVPPHSVIHNYLSHSIKLYIKFAENVRECLSFIINAENYIKFSELNVEDNVQKIWVFILKKFEKKRQTKTFIILWNFILGSSIEFRECDEKYKFN